jgi:flagellar biosynthetic protein FliO
MELDLINTGLKTMAMLAIVIGLLILVLYFMKRFMFPKEKTKGNLFIKVLSTLHLSPKERVEVIEISGEKIVLGVTPGNIRFLTKLSDINTGNGIRNGDEKELEIAE